MSPNARRVRRRRIWLAQGQACCWCGSALSYEQATLEHLKPVGRGGSDGWHNLAVACKDCNNKRKDRGHVAGSKLFTQKRLLELVAAAKTYADIVAGYPNQVPPKGVFVALAPGRHSNMWATFDQDGA